MKRITIILFVFLVTINAVAKANLQEIRNVIEENNANWQASENPIWNLSLEEQRAMLLHEEEEIPASERITLPRRFSGERWDVLDWRNFEGGNYVTPVKNQGSCGSCTAFGALATMESRIAIMDSTPDPAIDLSEQYILSCGPASCSGAVPSSVLSFLRDTGVPPEECLPYEADDFNLSYWECSEFAMANRNLIVWNSLASSVNSIKNALESGPVTAEFRVYEDFLSYSEGIYEHVWGDYAGFHVISIVGYNDSLECWICKNSWGEDWGEDGYFRIKWGEAEIENSCYLLIPSMQEPETFVNLDILSHTLQDTIEGDGDGYLEPGETASLQIEISNHICSNMASNIFGYISTENEYLTIIEEESPYPDLSPGDSALNQINFLFSFASGAELADVYFTLSLEGESDEVLFDESLSFSVDIPSPDLHWSVLAVHDTIVGDGDGILNPGETVCLESRLINAQAADEEEITLPVENITATLSSDDKRITVIKGETTFPDLDVGEFGLNQSDLIISIADTADFSVPTLTIDIQSVTDEYSYTKKINLFSGILSPDLHQNGWIFQLNFDVTHSPVPIDVNDDGFKEIIFVAEGNELNMYAFDKQSLPPFPVSVSLTENYSTGNYNELTIGDIDNDGSPEIIDEIRAGFGTGLAIIEKNGTISDTLTGIDRLYTLPVLSDLDSDGDLEIIFGIGNYFSDDDAIISIYHHTGEIFSEAFPYNFENAWRQKSFENSNKNLAVADINCDGKKEIVAVLGDCRVYVITLEGKLLDGWPSNKVYGIKWSPSVVSLGEEGVKIAVCSYSDQFYLLNPDGTIYRQVTVSDDIMCSPSFSDLENDGHVEMFFTTEDNLIYGLDAQGNTLDGWPVSAPAYQGTTPFFSDLNGDGKKEIMISGIDGNLHIFEVDGSYLKYFPYYIGPYNGTIPAVADLDNDGDLEIVYCDISGMRVLDMKWKSDEQECWNTFRGNFHRTGSYGECKDAPAEPPEKYTLSQNYPNPFNPETTIRFSLPKKSKIDLKIYDVTGKLVKHLMDDTKDAGDYSVKWNGNDEEDQPLPSGVYIYRIRAGEFEKTRMCILLR